VYLLPTDPMWQPAADAAGRAAEQARELAQVPKNVYPSVDVKFFRLMAVAYPFENLERITCPRSEATFR